MTQIERSLSSLDARVPSWDGQILVDVPCPVCSEPSRDYIATRADGLRVNRCPRCDLLYVSPRPSDESLSAFYSDYHALHKSTEDADSGSKLRSRKSEHVMLDSDPRMYFLRSHGIAIEGKRVLDVGSGDGTFLLLCRSAKASRMVGIEPDRNLAKRVSNELGLEIFNGYLDDYQASPRSFDVIVLWDVLEHIAHPAQFIQIVERNLASGGVVAAVTPNADAIKRLGNEWVGLRVDFEHMCYYGEKSVKHLFGSAGLSIKVVEPHGFPYLESPNITGRTDTSMRARVNDAMWKVPQIGSVYSRLASSWRALSNRWGDMPGDYHLFLIGSK